MRYRVGLRVAGLLLPLALAADLWAETQSVREAEPARGVNLPHPDILDLFGNASPPSEVVAERVAREEAQPIRRPEAAGTQPALAGGKTAASTRDERLIKRPAGPAAAWSAWDLAPLVAVVGLILVGALVVKRFLPARRLFTGSGVLEIVARAPLSSKHNLVLVKMGQRLVLLGVSPERINTLCVVDDPQQVAMLVGEIASGRPGSMTEAFAESFNEQAGAYEGEAPEQDAAATASGHVRGLLDKVRQLKNRRRVA